MNVEKFKFLNKKNLARLPKTAGVYCFKDKKSTILYIGKARDIKTRVKNHFSQPSYRDNFFINQIMSPLRRKRRGIPRRAGYGSGSFGGFHPRPKGRGVPAAEIKIGYIKTGSEIEALLLEAQLIKKFQPKYNVLWKDDKNYFYVAITKEKLPRVFITHQPKLQIKNPSLSLGNLVPYYVRNKNYKLKTNVGPFVEGRSLKRTLDFLRKVFPYYTKSKHPKVYCLWCSLKLCPGPDPDKKEYRKNINNLISVLKGKNKSVLKKLKKEMEKFSKMRNYEKAAEKRDQITMLKKIILHSRVIEPQIDKPPKSEKKYFLGRIEAYDISNTQGNEATGSMVVFRNGLPDKNQYRKFKIKISGKPNDIAMLKEILSRRLNHKEWRYPDLMIIDGGKAQLNIAVEIKNKELKTRKIKVVALAKKNNELFQENEKNPVLLKNLPADFSNFILRIRDEAHRFALAYHKTLRQKALLET